MPVPPAPASPPILNVAEQPPVGADPLVAKLLLKIGAVGVRPEQPYIFTSGWASPVYIDCRRLISFVDERRRIMASAARLLDERIGAATMDAIAGGETAGIPYAAWLAEALAKPMLYVRKKAKGFGRNAQIEGEFSDGQRVLLVEDLASDGASKVAFAEALRRAGLRVDDAFVIFYYGIFAGALQNLAAQGMRLHYLATWWDILREAQAAEAWSADTLATVRAFLQDPVGWSAAHGGRASLVDRGTRA